MSETQSFPLRFFPRETVQPVAYMIGGRDPDRERPFRVDYVHSPYGGSRWFYGYVENMFDPCRVLVRADTLEDAWEDLLTAPTVVRDCAISADDAADYPPPGSDEDYTTWNENGDRLDTEAVCMWPCEVRIVRSRDLPAGF